MKHILCYVVISIISIFFCEQIMAREDVGRQRVIVIDAGHGGKAYPGAVYGGVK